MAFRKGFVDLKIQKAGISSSNKNMQRGLEKEGGVKNMDSEEKSMGEFILARIQEGKKKAHGWERERKKRRFSCAPFYPRLARPFPNSLHSLCRGETGIQKNEIGPNATVAQRRACALQKCRLCPASQRHVSRRRPIARAAGFKYWIDPSCHPIANASSLCRY
ncbi:hypothetical protein DL89DRAFT_55207 [Linderina pennispora]|uniref:Uncharacterized protein n=1 Tax=Linderina pennispora TaxID=61395 RepID=A0A1Y1W166_9FUNG|nr:uncharacterized protein DL89DRAFT_55207 [Linderina pennispora]ORX67238.1 hypothetical protein DL89DRAFT_55207 [Linderina pennispora]